MHRQDHQTHQSNDATSDKYQDRMGLPQDIHSGLQPLECCHPGHDDQVTLALLLG